MLTFYSTSHLMSSLMCCNISELEFEVKPRSRLRGFIEWVCTAGLLQIQHICLMYAWKCSEMCGII